jgi:hypothetical protein
VKAHPASTLTQFSPVLRYAARVNLSYMLGFVSFHLVQRNEQEARENFIFSGIRNFVKSKKIKWAREVAKTVNVTN